MEVLTMKNKQILLALLALLCIPTLRGMQAPDEPTDCCTKVTNALARAADRYIGTQFAEQDAPRKKAKPEEAIPINWDWQKRCSALNDADPKATALTKEQLETELQFFYQAMNKSYLADSRTWVGQQPSAAFFDVKNTNHFEPYVQKLEVEPGSEVAFHGDIHGDVHSLNAYLAELARKGYMDKEDPFRIIKDKFYIIFLGDYTDRGKYGAEVIYTILRLKRTNPDKVVMVRGNHEDVIMNSIPSNELSFGKELEAKFNDKALLMQVQRMYNYLPVALYLVSGTQHKNAFLCCHGGPEIGFMETPALLDAPGAISCVKLGDLKRQDACNQLPEQLAYIKKFPDALNFTPKMPMMPFTIGFMWFDLSVENDKTKNNVNRGWECDQAFFDFIRTQQSTPSCTIRGIFRAHQHGDFDMMERILNKDNKGTDADIGVGKLWNAQQHKDNPNGMWDGIACTFCVSPNTPYGITYKELTFDTFGILTTAEQFNDWKLIVHRIETKR